jgi:hypothetical protein
MCQKREILTSLPVRQEQLSRAERTRSFAVSAEKVGEARTNMVKDREKRVPREMRG